MGMSPINGELRSIFQEKLASSTLNFEDAKLLSLELMELAPVGLPCKEPGFKIPYFDLFGSTTDFYRYRYLVPAYPGGIPTDKPVRYAQPSATGVEIYLPPYVRWNEVASDSAEAILITEGELKAAAACRAGYTCLGLGGVWSWKRGVNVAKVLRDDIQWTGRDVYIVYDSDALNNPNVVQAESALSRWLMDKGAKPRIVRLPPLPQVGKTGLDDLLALKGLDFFQSALENAYPFAEWKALHELNEEVCYVKEASVIIERASGFRMRPSDFTQHHYSHLFFEHQEATAKGHMRTVKKRTAMEWLAWSQRASAQRITFKPGFEYGVHDQEFNTWKGWGVQPVEGDVSPWLELMDHIFSLGENKEESRRWFEDWCAYPLQHPGTKMYSACLLWSLVHGVGKSIIGETIGKIYGKHYTQLDHSVLGGNFNEWGAERQFVLAEEASGSDKYGMADALKQLITQETMRVNKKFMSAYEIPDCLNYLFTSNKPDALLIEDSDRRFFIWEIKAPPLSDDFYLRYRDWKNGSGPSHLFHYLLHRDLSGFNPYAKALATSSKMEMAGLSKSDLDYWVGNLTLNPTEALRLGATTMNWSVATTEDLLSIYDPDRRGKVTANGLARGLRRAGFKQLRGGALIYIPGLGNRKLWALTPEAPMGVPWDMVSSGYAAKLYLDEHGVKGAKTEKY